MKGLLAAPVPPTSIEGKPMDRFGYRSSAYQKSSAAARRAAPGRWLHKASSVRPRCLEFARYALADRAGHEAVEVLWKTSTPAGGPELSPISMEHSAPESGPGRCQTTAAVPPDRVLPVQPLRSSMRPARPMPAVSDARTSFAASNANWRRAGVCSRSDPARSEIRPTERVAP